MNKISIVTVNRNNADGLERTIQSVIKQSYTNFEFIVIDGASTDDSLEVISKYVDHITFWLSEPDTGVFNAMNKAILRSSGDYCYFLNSGDELFAAETLMNVFGKRTYSDPFINGHQVNDYGFDKSRIVCKNRMLTLYDFYHGTLKHQATFIRRDLFDKYGMYDEGLKIVSDWKFFLQVIGLYDEQPVFVDVDIVLFEWNGLSTSLEWAEKQQRERQQVLDECLPRTIQMDYEKLVELNNYEAICNGMKKNKFFNMIVKGTFKIFK